MNILEDDEVRAAAKEYRYLFYNFIFTENFFFFFPSFLTSFFYYFFNRSSWPTFPQVYIKGEFVGGCDINVDLFESGELQKLLEEKGILKKE